MNRDRIFFNLSFDFREEDDYDHSIASPSSDAEFLTELVIEEGHYYLKIFYEGGDTVERRITSWEPTHRHSILSRFRVTKIMSTERLTNIEFVNYHHKGIQTSTANNEFGKYFFTISLEGVRLTYETIEPEDSEIYLNDTAFKLIELHYKYNVVFPWKYDFKWDPENAISTFVPFHQIEFIPEHHFYRKTSNSDRSVAFEKEPRLRIKHNGLSFEENLRHTDLICDLYSLYCNEPIKWRVARIYAEGKLYIERRRVVSEENNFAHGLFMMDFIMNPLNLIQNVKAAKVFDNSLFLSRIVNQYTYSFKLSGESKFMLLYSILEQLRNKYIEQGEIEKEANGNWRKVKQEYQFTVAKKESVIKQALESVLKIVVPEEQEMFREEISHKGLNIKLMSMQHQFASYFAYVSINPASYNLDFIELKGLRNKVFHGGDISGDAELVEKVTWYEYLPKFVGRLILVYCGIDVLDTRNMKRPK